MPLSMVKVSLVNADNLQPLTMFPIQKCLAILYSAEVSNDGGVT